MTLLSLFALVLPAALVAPKATKREAQLAEQWEREIQLNKRRVQTARLEALETECAAWGAKDKQTVRKLGLSGFLRGVGDVRIAHDSHRRIRTGPASAVAGGG